MLSHSFQKSYKPFVPDFFEGIKDSTNEVLHMFTKYIFCLSNQPILHSWYNFQHSARLTCWIQNNANQLHICLCTQTRRQLHSQTLVSLSAKKPCLNISTVTQIWRKRSSSSTQTWTHILFSDKQDLFAKHLALTTQFLNWGCGFTLTWKSTDLNHTDQSYTSVNRTERNSTKWTPHYLRPVRQPDTANFRSNASILQSVFPHTDEPLLPAHIPRDSHFQQQFNSVISWELLDYSMECKTSEAAVISTSINWCVVQSLRHQLSNAAKNSRKSSKM